MNRAPTIRKSFLRSLRSLRLISPVLILWLRIRLIRRFAVLNFYSITLAVIMLVVPG